jgi:PBP1b-binding outer membrane lipoprotein LpoB
MSKKLWISAVLIITVLISGCIFDKKVDQNPTSGVIPQTGLPVGFTYMGTHETPVDIGGNSINATEGVYKYNNVDDVYVQLIKNNNTQELVIQYKAKYKDANWNPFEEVSFNGHNATQIKDYFTENAKQTAYYSIMWTNGSSLIIVGSSPDAHAVLSLATATGN